MTTTPLNILIQNNFIISHLSEKSLLVLCANVHIARHFWMSGRVHCWRYRCVRLPLANIYLAQQIDFHKYITSVSDMEKAWPRKRRKISIVGFLCDQEDVQLLCWTGHTAFISSLLPSDKKISHDVFIQRISARVQVKPSQTTSKTFSESRQSCGNGILFMEWGLIN